MSSTSERSRHESTSTLYTIGSALIAAGVLALALFLVIRSFQWRAALADLRAEPGIEILAVERAGLFKKRLVGLRDPLAPPAMDFLAPHHIGEHAVELRLTEYHSLNTPYAREREAQLEERVEGVRDDLIEAAAAFAERVNAQRSQDVEKITRMLFAAKFPEEMKTVSLAREDDTWFAEGGLYEPVYSEFRDSAPDYLLEGRFDFSRLENRTETRTRSLRERIESTDLFQTDLDGNFTHVAQVARLLRDYDEVCAISRVAKPRLRIRIVAPGDAEGDLRVAALQKELSVLAEIESTRFDSPRSVPPPEEEDDPSDDPPLDEAEEDLVAFVEILPPKS